MEEGGEMGEEVYGRVVDVSLDEGGELVVVDGLFDREEGGIAVGAGFGGDGSPRSFRWRSFSFGWHFVFCVWL